jgi:hypothetical protein
MTHLLELPNGTVRLRLPYGRQQDVAGPRCPHCAAAIGRYHAAGCAGELCSRCGRFLDCCLCNNNHEWSTT